MLDTATYTPRLKAHYSPAASAPALKEQFGYKNDMMIPRLDKIVLNIGCGAEAVKDSKKAKSAVEDLTHHRRPDARCRRSPRSRSPASGSAN